MKANASRVKQNLLDFFSTHMQKSNEYLQNPKRFWRMKSILKNYGWAVRMIATWNKKLNEVKHFYQKKL